MRTGPLEYPPNYTPWQIISRPVGHFALSRAIETSPPVPFPDNWRQAVEVLDLVSQEVKTARALAGRMSNPPGKMTAEFVSGSLQTVQDYYGTRTVAQAFFMALDDRQIAIEPATQSLGRRSPPHLQSFLKHTAQGSTINEIPALIGVSPEELQRLVQHSGELLDCEPNPLVLLRKSYEMGIRELPGITGFIHSLPYHRAISFEPREREVFELRMEGRTNREVGNLLGPKEANIKYIVRKILRKYRANYMAAAGSKAIVNGDVVVPVDASNRPPIGKRSLEVLDALICGRIPMGADRPMNESTRRAHLETLRTKLNIKEGGALVLLAQYAYRMGICVVGYTPLQQLNTKRANRPANTGYIRGL